MKNAITKETTVNNGARKENQNRATKKSVIFFGENQNSGGFSNCSRYITIVTTSKVIINKKAAISSLEANAGSPA